MKSLVSLILIVFIVKSEAMPACGDFDTCAGNLNKPRIVREDCLLGETEYRIVREIRYTRASENKDEYTDKLSGEVYLFLGLLPLARFEGQGRAGVSRLYGEFYTFQGVDEEKEVLKITAIGSAPDTSVVTEIYDIDYYGPLDCREY